MSLLLRSISANAMPCLGGGPPRKCSAWHAIRFLLWSAATTSPPRSGLVLDHTSEAHFARIKSSARLSRSYFMVKSRLRSYLSIAICSISPAFAAAQSPRSEETRPPETSRQRLNEPLLAVDVSPDGRRIVCSGQNRTIEQIGLDGAEYPALKNAPGGWCVCYSPDGKVIAGCGLDRIIRLWEADTGRELRQLQGHVQIAWMAAFLPGGDRLVSVGEDSTI